MNLTPRIWWISQKKMYQAYSICYNTMTAEIAISNSEHYALLDYEYYLSRPTGRLDIHGKMIYEGDVVNVHHHDPYEDSYYDVEGTVIWGYRSSGFTIYDRNGNGNARPVPAPEDDTEEIKILGNVFENPGLVDQVVVNKKLIKC